jgi:peptidoglycan/LPS O-acetylase OafA/YrhL
MTSEIMCSDMGQHRYDVLDGMRGVAAVAVMLYHFNNYEVPLNAPLAVDFFFILSGFVIAYSYSSRLANGMSFGAFIGRRISRLYPMFIVSVLLGGPILYVNTLMGHSDYSRRSIVAATLANLLCVPYLNEGNITNVGTVSHGALFPVNGPLWSLFFEMIASAAFFLLVRLQRRGLVKVMGLSFAGIAVSGVMSSFVDYQPVFGHGFGWATLNFFGGFPRVFYGFTCGIVLYLGVREMEAKSERRKTKPLLLYAALFAVLAFPFALKGTYYLLVIGVVAPALVLLGALTECKNRCEQALSSVLGWMSYPIYCLHTPIGIGVDIVYEKYNVAAVTGVSAVVASVWCTIISAVIITKVYEEPCRKYLTMKLATGPGGVSM